METLKAKKTVLRLYSNLLSARFEYGTCEYGNDAQRAILKKKIETLEQSIRKLGYSAYDLDRAFD